MAEPVLSKDRHDPRIQVTVSCSCGMTFALNEAPNISNGTAPDPAATFELGQMMWRIHLDRHQRASGVAAPEGDTDG